MFTYSYSAGKNYQYDEHFLLGFEKVLKMQASVIDLCQKTLSECQKTYIMKLSPIANEQIMKITPDGSNISRL